MRLECYCGVIGGGGRRRFQPDGQSNYTSLLADLGLMPLKPGTGLNMPVQVKPAFGRWREQLGVPVAVLFLRTGHHRVRFRFFDDVVGRFG